MQDTYYVGTIKGVGLIYQQTFIDAYAKVAFAKVFDCKHALVAADMLNDKVLPFYEEYVVLLLSILTDGGTEYCGARDHHEFELYLALEDIDHVKTKVRNLSNFFGDFEISDLPTSMVSRGIFLNQLVQNTN